MKTSNSLLMTLDKIGTVICNMPTTDAFAGFTIYSVYLTEDNPKYAISLMQKNMEDRIIFHYKKRFPG